ncbi:MAG: hypothetical protein SA339_03855 [Methanomassiliicoccus sp.]|nr:hypothetical protein [Methanomassiliicoccus sp.]
MRKRALLSGAVMLVLLGGLLVVYLANFPGTEPEEQTYGPIPPQTTNDTSTETADVGPTASASNSSTTTDGPSDHEDATDNPGCDTAPSNGCETLFLDDAGAHTGYGLGDYAVSFEDYPGGHHGHFSYHRGGYGGVLEMKV